MDRMQRLRRNRLWPGIAGTALVLIVVAVVVLAQRPRGPCEPDNGDRPQEVCWADHVYRVTCGPVHTTRLGERIEVYDESSVRFGDDHAVAGRAIKGIRAREAVAVDFAQAVCGRQGEHWTVATSPRYPGPQKAMTLFFEYLATPQEMRTRPNVSPRAVP